MHDRISPKKAVLALAVLALLVLPGFGCKKSLPKYNTTLEVWGVFDDSDAYSQMFNEYQGINDNVSNITYRKFKIEEYRRDLLDALAAGNGPDIFMIHNTWLPAFEDKIVAAPANIINEQTYLDSFVDVVAFDFMRDGVPYAVPLSVDSLALYYNKDMFNAAGVTAPPSSWQEFVDIVKKLKRVDEFGNITQQGAALGTAENINRSTDLLVLLMMQEGAEMSTADGSATFDEPVTVSGKSEPAGTNAMRFYTQFAQPTSTVYTWNPRQHYSLDAFFEETLGMMINYSWHYDTIARKNEKLNFTVAPIPQLEPDRPVNHANYWGFAVAKNKTIPEQTLGEREITLTDALRKHEAWQLLRYMSVPPEGRAILINGVNREAYAYPLKIDPAATYLEKTRKPAARRDLVGLQRTDPRLAPFASGNLIAQSWVQIDASANEAILAETIESVLRGELTVQKAITLAANRISQFAR